MKPVREQLAPRSAPEVVACRHIRGADFGCTWHFHPELEITLVRSGGTHRWIGDKISPLLKGDMTFVGTNLPHDYRNDRASGGNTEDVDAVNIQFHPRFLGGDWLEHAEMISLKKLFDRASTGLQIIGKTRDRVEELMLDCLEAHGLQRLILLLEIFRELENSEDLVAISSTGFTPELPFSDNERMGKISAFIQDQIDQPLYLADVAAHVGMTEVTFSRYFRTRTGKTFPTYLNEIRIARVCRLLAETDGTVSEIAFACGFDSMANFQRQFKRNQSCTPTVYRKRISGAGAGR